MEQSLGELGKMLLLAAVGITALGARLWTASLIRQMVRQRRSRPPILPPVEAVFSCSAWRQLARLRATREDRAGALAAGVLRGPIGERLVRDCAELERAALDLMDHGNTLARYLQQLSGGLLPPGVAGTAAAAHGSRLRDAERIQTIRLDLLARAEILLATLEAVPSRVMALHARELAGRARASEELAVEAACDLDDLLGALDAALGPATRNARGHGTADAVRESS